MDPNTNLMEQECILVLAAEWREAKKAGDKDEIAYLGMLRQGDTARLRELRDGLSFWLTRGGLAPDWSQAPNARKYYGR